MQKLEQLISPIIHNLGIIDNQLLNENELSLIKNIKKQKLDVIQGRLKTSEVNAVRAEIAESWLRSYNYGVDLYKFNQIPVMDKLSFEQLLKEKNLLIKAAEPYAKGMENLVSGNNSQLFLSDGQGVILEVFSGNFKFFEEANPQKQVLPGKVWNESAAGTCAHIMALILGRPTQLSGPEHYCEALEDAYCSSAPIFGINNKVEGSLTIATPYLHRQNSDQLALVVLMVLSIQKDLQCNINEILNQALKTSDEASLIIDKFGIITKINETAQEILNHTDNDLVGMNIEDVLGNQPLIQSVFKSGKPVLETDIVVKKGRRKLRLNTVSPVLDSYNNTLAYILAFAKDDRVSVKRSSVSEAQYTFDQVVGNSPPSLNTVQLAKKFAKIDTSILIQGESGTGKELFSQAIHNESRADGPFIPVNCAAIPKSLIESELFGYEGGSFTGAERQGRPGKIELANGGTLFLDEIGDMPIDLQAVLLRVLEEKKVMRVGGSQYLPVDFRLVTATNKDLWNLVQENQFREDLYYRVAAFKLTLPPLRERGTDIIELALHFIELIAQKQQISAPVLSRAAKYALLQYQWPGNVRQLQNTMLYAVNMCNNGIIQPEDFPDEVKNAAINTEDKMLIDEVDFDSNKNNSSIKELEKKAIDQALQQTNNNVREAAIILGLSKSTLYRKIKNYYN